MNLEHVLIVIAVIVAFEVVIRWGSQICMIYAVFYLCTGQETAAMLAFIFACLIEAFKRFHFGWLRALGLYWGPWI